MADLKILEADGWDELPQIHTAISQGTLDIQALWTAVSAGDGEEAIRLLAAAGYQLDDDITTVTMVSLPNDIQGAFYRVWVQ